MDRSFADRVVLIPRLRGHGPLVERWLQEEHVRRSWPRRDSHTSTVDYSRGRGEQRIIVVEGVPVGFLRCQQVDRAEWAAIGLDVPADALCVDIVIGTEPQCGQGIGSAAIGMLAEELRSETLVAATSMSNIACRRAFQKAGFVEREQFREPMAAWMVLLVRARK